jgi:hypothetical protein
MLLARELLRGARAASNRSRPTGRHRDELWLRICVSILTLHLIVTAAFSDLDASGKVLFVVMISGASFAVCVLDARILRAGRVVLCVAAGTLGLANSVGITVNRITRTGFEPRDTLVAPAVIASLGLVALGTFLSLTKRSWRARPGAIAVWRCLRTTSSSRSRSAAGP